MPTDLGTRPWSWHDELDGAPPFANRGYEVGS